MTCQLGFCLAKLHKLCTSSVETQAKNQVSLQVSHFFSVLDSSSCHNKHSSSYECYCFLPIFFLFRTLVGTLKLHACDALP